MRTYPLLVFYTLFLFIRFIALSAPHFLWLCNNVRVQCPHYVHVLYLGVIIVHWWYRPFIMSLYPFLGCHLRVYRTHGYLVNIMHGLIFFFFSADELGAIFIFIKLHPMEINNFTWIYPYRYYSGVLMILGFYTACFLFVFISVYCCILVICVNLLFHPCLVVPIARVRQIGRASDSCYNV